MDAQTELERALTLIDDLVSLLDPETRYSFRELESLKDNAEDFLRKHKRIP